MKNRNFLIASILLVAVVLFASCMQEQDENCEYGFTRGTVVDLGSPQVDGCGWVIQIGSVYYHPLNLTMDFEISDLPVLIKYRTDPEEFRCGRGGMIYQSIRITEIRKNGKEVGFLTEDEWDKYTMDPFRLDSAYVDGDWLMMHVGYSGGCKDHDFNLWKLPANALDPPPVELALSHEDHGDMCEAYIQRWLAFSLFPLREKGKHEVKFLLRGSPEMSAYFGEFTYIY